METDREEATKLIFEAIDMFDHAQECSDHKSYRCLLGRKADEQTQFSAYKQFCDDTATEKKRTIAEAEESLWLPLPAVSKKSLKFTVLKD